MIKPSNYIKYGKGACVVGMAGILGMFSLQPHVINYEPNDWERVLQRLEYLHTKIIRMDATACFHPVVKGYGGDGDYESGGDDYLINSAQNQSIVNDCLFNDQFDQVIQQCQFLQAMSFIRPTIHEVVNERRRARALEREQNKNQKSSKRGADHAMKIKDVVVPVDDERMSDM